MYGVTGQSCIGLGNICQGESCCESIAVPGGTFPMGQTDGGVGETPEHPVTVSTFSLDKYEVTVGRFRKFVDAFDGTPPPANAGTHPYIPGSGWQSPWPTVASKADLIAALQCGGTWTDSPGANESNAVNCTNFYEAFAFCAWDGGRLPTEAEWEYAAAGGDENRLYPWGNSEPTCGLAKIDVSGCSAIVDPVGARPTGAGRWGHLDLCGNVTERTIDWYEQDWYSGGGATCTNCSNLLYPSGIFRVSRGGYFNSNPFHSRAAVRNISSAPDARSRAFGFRCARTP